MAANANVYALVDQGEQYTLEDQLELLADVTQSFAASLEIDETLRTAIEKFMQYMDAEAASIFLLEQDDAELVCRACAGPVDINGLRLPADAGIIGKTVSSRTCQIVRDVRDDPAFSGKVDASTGFVTRSILCAPLLVQRHCIGALELINKHGGDGLFDDRDRHLLVALASSAALAINNARMAQRLLEQERMRRELQLAREIQMDLLPAPRADSFPVAGVNVPALEVSGDFYDFMVRADGHIYFSLADVSGKGMNAALLMAKASSLLHHLAKGIGDPGVLLARVNEEICESVSHGMFITIVAGFFDPKARAVRMAIAGHQPPLLHRRDGSFEEIPATAPPLGIIPGCAFPVTTVSLQDSSLYIFTDGVTECAGSDSAPLTTEGLIRLIEGLGRDALSARLQNLVAALGCEAGTRHDDITLILIEERQA